MQGRTTDNNCGVTWDSVFQNDPDHAAWLRFHNRFANIKILSLLKDCPELLVFPQGIFDIKDGWEESCIFQSQNDSYIETGNIMGFIENEGTTLTIASRFYPNGDDFFLHYLLQKVFGLHQMNWSINSQKQSIWDFLPYLFPTFLKNALNQGIYKEYHEFQYNDNKIHGKIDLSRHLKLNIPFQASIACSSRELSLCNPITLLVRATIDLLLRKPHFSMLLHADSETQNAMAQIMRVTEKWNSISVKEIVDKNIRLIAHPYYTKYRALQALCLQILRHQKVSYGNDKKTVSGILFDGAWLWEEYINTLLKKAQFIHPRNRQKTGFVYVFDTPGPKRYPDFYKNGTVFDAKYKRLSQSSKGEVSRDDLHQLITYMFILNSNLGGFIYPDPNLYANPVCLGRLNGLGKIYDSKLYLIPLRIPTETSLSYNSFCEKMARIEYDFMDNVSSLLKTQNK